MSESQWMDAVRTFAYCHADDAAIDIKLFDSYILLSNDVPKIVYHVWQEDMEEICRKVDSVYLPEKVSISVWFCQYMFQLKFEIMYVNKYFKHMREMGLVVEW